MKKNKGFILGLTLFGLCLTGCSGPVEKQPGHPDPSIDVSVEPDGIIEINTEVQKNYLADTYGNISKYGSGNSEKSKPLSAKLNWSYENTDESQIAKVAVNIVETKTSLVYLSKNYERNQTSIDLTNLKLGTTYHAFVNYYDEKGNSLGSGQADFETSENGVRFIDIDGLSNVRDCGNWVGLDGKRIKQGLLYRGEELNQQNYGKNGNGTIDPDDSKERAKEKPYGQKITAKGIDTFVNQLGIKTECDIRGYENFDWATNRNESPTECGGLKNGKGIIEDIKYVINPVHTSRDKIYYDDYGKAAVKNFFGMLADEENYLPLYFHCAQGKDRTGFLAYLFEAFLGVSRDDCMRDYLLSNLGKTGSVNEGKLVGSSAQYNYVDYLDGLEVSTQGSPAVKYQAEGDTMAERAYNYLISCGLSESQLETIRNTFLED